MQNDYWKKKLMAFLHDPPCKPLDIPRHERIGEAFILRAGLPLEEMALFHRACDATAAAADRFPFPASAVLKSEFTGAGDTPFRHPLGGGELRFESALPSAAYAEGLFQESQGGILLDSMPAADREWANFFLHWRRWPVETARSDYRTYFLPADTRIPDHSIWTHNSMVSALQGCVREGRMEPCFMLFQLGPVQKFIGQARSTRDLWSGSYLISWLTAHAIKAVTDRVGPDAIVFPFLRRQPIFDLLHSDRLYARIAYPGRKREETLWERMGLTDEEILTPNLPNRFFAVVPEADAADIAGAAEDAVRVELKKVGEACWDWIHGRYPMKEEWRRRFDAQVEAFPEIAWQVSPWTERSVHEALEAFQKLAPEPALRLKRIHSLALSVPERDSRYFNREGSDLSNAGFCWPYYYALTDWLLAARRNTRDFRAWDTDDQRAGARKDTLSGVEEVVGSEEWWQGLKDHGELRFLFRSGDVLGAMNMIKRVWHRAYLEPRWGINTSAALRFESVPGIAAADWRARLLQLIEDDAEFRARMVRAREAVCAHRDASPVPCREQGEELSSWLAAADPEILSLNAWCREAAGPPALPQEVDSALRELYRHKITGQDGKERVGEPPAYFAVIAFDGDEMGKWVSGEKTPSLLGQLSNSARDYFRKVPGAESVQRPLSPSYHLQFSEALSNFSLYVARPIVEYFRGQLIYAGGDDVLAMVPAGSALDCAEALYLGFRGEARLQELVPGIFDIASGQEGFVRLKSPIGEQPSWPLMVPGTRAGASAGISIAHARTPLQGVIGAARRSERRAKDGYGRSACAVSIYKRSGEILEWGFKWQTSAPALYRLFSRLTREGALSGRFGYALDAAVSRYHSENVRGVSALSDCERFEEIPVILAEVRHVLRRQSSPGFEHGALKDEFLNLCTAYLKEISSTGRRCAHDFAMIFGIANFLQRGES